MTISELGSLGELIGAAATVATLLERENFGPSRRRGRNE